MQDEFQVFGHRALYGPFAPIFASWVLVSATSSSDSCRFALAGPSHGGCGWLEALASSSNLDDSGVSQASEVSIPKLVALFPDAPLLGLELRTDSVE